MTDWRAVRAVSLAVFTTMSSAACSVHEGSSFGRPSTSTRHMRHCAGRVGMPGW